MEVLMFKTISSAQNWRI